MSTRSVSHRIRRTRTERRLRVRALILGTLLTILTIILLASGALQILERGLYDARARWCQFFRAAPTTRLVHVDIDDGALETVGRWPWPRAILSDVVDELALANSKAVAFDVNFSETEDPIRNADDSITDNDAIFADSIHRTSRVLIPASLVLDKPEQTSPEISAAQSELVTNLELPLEELRQHLTQDEYVRAQHNAMSIRVRQEITADPQITFENIRAKLLPGWARLHLDSKAPVVRILTDQYQQVLAEKALESFTLPMPAGVSAYHSFGAVAALPIFANAARFSGIVDHIRESDGRLRRVPLVGEFHGRLLPQMGLVLACAALDVDPKSLQISPDHITIPTPDGNNIKIPTANKQTHLGYGGMFMELPWFGNGDWHSMYATPGGGHLNITILSELADWRRRVRINNEQIDKAILDILRIENNWGPPDRYQSLKLSPDDFVARLPYIEQLRKNEDIIFAIDQLRQTPVNQRTKKDADPDSFDILPVLSDQSTKLLALIKNRSTQLHQLLSNNVVLIGETASSTTDMINTPLGSSVPGVVAHGVVVNAILTRQLWKEAPPSITLLHTLFAGLLATIAVAHLKHWKAFTAAAFLLLGYLFLNGIILFDKNNYLVGAAGPVTAVILVVGAVTIITATVEAAEKARITHHFRTYVDPQLADYFLENPEHLHLKGEIKELTVVFTDLVGFTAITEQMRERTVEILNEYLTVMVPIIRSRRGLVNKFLGDGVMIIFGALWENPNHATDAVDTVLTMIAATKKFSDELQSRGLPAVRMRAGITTGPMVVGDAGSRTARDYTVLGDLVNTSARLEQANKRLDTRMLISRGTYNQLDNRFLIRPVGHLMLAGKTEPVEAFEVLAPITQATPDDLSLAHLSSSLISQITASQPTIAQETLNKLITQFGPNKFTSVYTQLCQSPTPQTCINA